MGETTRTAAAAAKSLQSYLTLCNPINGSPPGSPIPGILKARTMGQCNLNQIPYTVEVINRFKGLGLVNRVPEELWTEVCNIV